MDLVFNRTSLHYACSKNKAEVVKLLVKEGADVNVADETGATPLHRAVVGGTSLFFFVKDIIIFDDRAVI